MLREIVNLLLFLLCCGWFSPVLAGETPVHTLRCVTWNLQWFPGRSPTPTKEAAAEHIAGVRASLKKLGPDILILQEVASEAAVVEAIQDLPEMKVAVVSRFKRGGLIDGQQIAICSNLPARYVYSSTWTNGWAGPPRGFAFAALSLEDSTVNVVGLHLKSNLGDAQLNSSKREDAVEQVMEHISRTDEEAKDKTTRWIVAGDFNTDFDNPQTPSERSLKMFLQKGFFWTFEGVPFRNRITCPGKGRYPDACFDHLFVKNLGRPVAGPVPEISGSDHFPVAFDFLANPARKPPAIIIPDNEGSNVKDSDAREAGNPKVEATRTLLPKEKYGFQ